jgi:hypothetical protein
MNIPGIELRITLLLILTYFTNGCFHYTIRSYTRAAVFPQHTEPLAEGLEHCRQQSLRNPSPLVFSQLNLLARQSGRLDVRMILHNWPIFTKLTWRYQSSCLITSLRVCSRPLTPLKVSQLFVVLLHDFALIAGIIDDLASLRQRLTGNAPTGPEPLGQLELQIPQPPTLGE